MALLICRTCPRYDTVCTGEFARSLQHRLSSQAREAQLSLRYVHCLGGCPDQGVIAVDAPGKARVRFTGITPEHSDAVLVAAAAHYASPTGDPSEWEVPVQLQPLLSSVTSKR